MKSLVIESSPAGVGADSAMPGVGELGDVTASLPLTCSIDATAVLQADVLFPCLRAIPVAVASLFKHFHGLTAFRRSSENQYHKQEIVTLVCFRL